MDVQGFVNSQGRISQGVVVGSEEIVKRYVKGMADLPVAIAQARAAIESADARDVRCRVGDLRCDDVSGGIFISSNGTLSEVYGVTHHALGHMVEATGTPLKRAQLEWLEPRARALAFFQMVTAGKNPDSQIYLRTARHESGQRVIRAIVSEIHSRESGDDLALFDALERTVGDVVAKARIVRTWDGLDAEIVFPNRGIEVAKNDPVFYGLRATNSEVKKGSMFINGALWRLVCTNGLVRPTDEGVDVRIRHVGNVAQRIGVGVSAAMLGLDTFAEQLRQSYTQALPAELSRETILAAAGDRLALPESTTTGAFHLWDSDGALSAGNTVAGLVHALTRAAQGERIETARRVEEQAARLLTGGLGVLGLA